MKNTTISICHTIVSIMWITAFFINSDHCLVISLFEIVLSTMMMRYFWCQTIKNFTFSEILLFKEIANIQRSVIRMVSVSVGITSYHFSSSLQDGLVAVLPKTHKRSLKELKSNNNVVDNVEKATEELPPAVKGKAVKISFVAISLIRSLSSRSFCSCRCQGWQ